MRQLTAHVEPCVEDNLLVDVPIVVPCCPTKKNGLRMNWNVRKL